MVDIGLGEYKCFIYSNYMYLLKCTCTYPLLAFIAPKKPGGRGGWTYADVANITTMQYKSENVFYLVWFLLVQYEVIYRLLEQASKYSTIRGPYIYEGLSNNTTFRPI
jgi:hypothetical protein